MKGYIYLIREREYIMSKEPIYKIGRTDDWNRRMKEYGACEMYMLVRVNNAYERELQIIEIFRREFETKTRERFNGSVSDMMDIISRICCGDYKRDIIKALETGSIEMKKYFYRVASSYMRLISDALHDNKDLFKCIFDMSDSNTKRNMLLLNKQHRDQFISFFIFPDQSQRKFLYDFNNGYNILLEGPAGSGKSHCIRLVRHRATVIAMTEHAAGLIGGVSYKSYVLRLQHDHKKGIAMCADRYIIDETGLMEVEELIYFDKLLREVTKYDKPFGGKQIVLVGDSLQIVSRSPIILSNCLGNYGFNLIILNELHRQIDQTSRSVLESLRNGLICQKLTDLKNTVFKPNSGLIHIVPSGADEENAKMLESIGGTLVPFRRIGELDTILCEYIELKKGAQVILLRDMPEQKLWHGSIGKVISLNGDVLVKFIAKKNPVYIKPITLHDYATGQSCTQIPLALGWYRNITDIQGSTLDRIIIHSDKRPGYLYTALSRVRDIKNVRIIGDISLDRNPIQDILTCGVLRTGQVYNIQPIKIEKRKKRSITVAEIKEYHSSEISKIVKNGITFNAVSKYFKGIDCFTNIVEDEIRNRVNKKNILKDEGWPKRLVGAIWKLDSSIHDKLCNCI